MRGLLNVFFTICFLGTINLAFAQPTEMLEQAAKVEELVTILSEGKIDAAMTYLSTDASNTKEIKAALEKVVTAIKKNGKAEDYFLAISPNHLGKANHTNFECTFFVLKGGEKEPYYRMNMLFDTQKSKDKIAVVTFEDKEKLNSKELNYLENEAKQIEN